MPTDQPTPGAPAPDQALPADGTPAGKTPARAVDPAKVALMNEDWLRTMSWDVRLPDGSPAASLTEVAYALGIDRAEAANRILTQPFGVAAPPAIKTEAQDLQDAAAKGSPDPGADPAADFGALADKPTGPNATAPVAAPDAENPAEDAAPSEEADTPDVGDKVTVEGKAARIDLIVSGGTMPGIPDSTPVTEPMARLAFEDGTKAAIALSALRAPATTYAPATVNDLLTGRPDGPTIAAKAAQVYARGLRSAPDDTDTKAWAFARVTAFLVKVDGGTIPGYTRDDDLLPWGHPERATAVERLT
jgi:hypothetical protein